MTLSYHNKWLAERLNIDTPKNPLTLNKILTFIPSSQLRDIVLVAALCECALPREVAKAFDETVGDCPHLVTTVRILERLTRMGVVSCTSSALCSRCSGTGQHSVLNRTYACSTCAKSGQIKSYKWCGQTY